MSDLSPELEFAVACSVWPPTDTWDQRIRRTAARPIDWQSLLRVCYRHGVIGLVHAGILRAGARVPAHIFEIIETEALAQAKINLALAAEALRLQRQLEDGGIESLLLKGAALAMHAYGDLGLRSGKDIDILVQRAALPKAIEIILDAGYRRFDPPPDVSGERLRMVIRHRRDLGFVHVHSGLCLELHWRLFLNPYAMTEESLSRCYVPLSANGKLRTLGDEDLFAYLCMHGAYHWWSQLKWLADVHALLCNFHDVKVETYYSAAEDRGAGRAAGLALVLCELVFETELPDSVSRRIKKIRGITWMKKTALYALNVGSGERGRHHIRFGTTRGSLSTLLLGSSWGYRCIELKNLFINETDLLTVRLPRRLRILYPLLRIPLWFWRHVRRARG